MFNIRDFTVWWLPHIHHCCGPDAVMTSWYGHPNRITGPFWGESAFTEFVRGIHRRLVSLTKASNKELFSFFLCQLEQFLKQTVDVSAISEFVVTEALWGYLLIDSWNYCKIRKRVVDCLSLSVSFTLINSLSILYEVICVDNITSATKVLLNMIK